MEVVSAGQYPNIFAFAIVAEAHGAPACFMSFRVEKKILAKAYVVSSKMPGLYCTAVI